uniref:Uncharacterized protein n=1 Tax=Anguilla anguilla TaxID=7936 RepID=A0A0E9SHS7_ANGAN
MYCVAFAVCSKYIHFPEINFDSVSPSSKLLRF